MDILPKPLYLYFLVSGIFSLKYSVSENGKKTLVYCSRNYLWVVVMFLFQMLGTLFLLGLRTRQLFSEYPISPKHKQNILCSIIVSLLSNLVTTINFISCSKYTNKLLKVYLALSQFEINLCKPIKHTKTYINLILSLLPILILYIFYNFLSQEQDRTFLLNILLFIQQSTLIAVNIQYCHICHIISYSFIGINEEIQQEINLLSYEMLLKDFQGPLSTSKFAKGGPASLSKVKALMDFYWLLCKTVQETNAFYSTTLFAQSCFSFVSITVKLYQVFTLVLQSFDPHRLIDVIVHLCGVATHVFQLMLMVWKSTKVTNMAEETAPMVCKLLNRELNSDVKRQMELFLLQLLHHNARFSAFGFFCITTQILTSIAGSVTTYLVILIQFQTADESDHNK